MYIFFLFNTYFVSFLPVGFMCILYRYTMAMSFDVWMIRILKRIYLKRRRCIIRKNNNKND